MTTRASALQNAVLILPTADEHAVMPFFPERISNTETGRRHRQHQQTRRPTFPQIKERAHVSWVYLTIQEETRVLHTAGEPHLLHGAQGRVPSTTKLNDSSKIRPPSTSNLILIYSLNQR